MNKDFKYKLDETVSLTESHEEGVVIGRAEYLNSENTYLIRYKAADGRQVEDWWSESAVKVKRQ